MGGVDGKGRPAFGSLEELATEAGLVVVGRISLPR